MATLCNRVPLFTFLYEGNGLTATAVTRVYFSTNQLASRSFAETSVLVWPDWFVFECFKVASLSMNSQIKVDSVKKYTF